MDPDGGPSLFSHTFGPLVYNGNFNVLGRIAESYLNTSSLINKAVNDVKKVDLLSEVHSYASGVLGPNAVWTPSGTYVVSSYQDVIVPIVGQAEALSSLTVSGAEFRNMHILSGVEFIGTSGAASSNNFQIYNLDPSNYSRYKGNYAINNTLIKLKAIDGLPRVRFDLAKSYTPSGAFSPHTVSVGPKFGSYNFETSVCTTDRKAIDYYNGVSNFLSPDHEYSIKIDALTGRESQPIFGESQFSVWVHTGVDSDGYYHYWNEDGWVKYDARKLTKAEVIQTQSKVFTPKKTYPKEIIACYDNIINSKYLVNNPRIIRDLEEYHFDTYEWTFDTKNGSPCHSHIHTYDQEYYVEIFMNPSISEGRDTFLLLDKVSLRDETLHNYSKVTPSPTFSLNPCPSSITTTICPEDLRKLFIHYNKISATSKGSGLATRIATDSSSVYNTSGGSRISYREHPFWVSSTYNAHSAQITGIRLDT